MTLNLKEQNRKLALQKKLMYALYFLVFGMMMAVGTKNDLQIDMALFNYQNGFAVFMERYGMLPGFSIKLLACSVLCASFPSFEKAKENIRTRLPKTEKFCASRGGTVALFILYMALFLYILFNALLGANDFLNNLLGSGLGGNLTYTLDAGEHSKWLAIPIWAVARSILVCACLVAMRKVNRDHRRVLVFMAIAGLLMYQSGDIIGALKDHFHRVRFREMVAYSHALIDASGRSCRGGNDLPREWVETTSFIAYAPWYQVGNDYGVYSNSTSFPSGHTASAAYTMLLPMLAGKSKKANKLFIPAFLLSFAYTLTMGITRLIRGAHYMTDIAAGAMIMMAMLLLIMGVMNTVERTVQKKSKQKEREAARRKMRESRAGQETEDV